MIIWEDNILMHFKSSGNAHMKALEIDRRFQKDGGDIKWLEKQK